MASRLMDCTKDESGMSVFGGCSDVVASNYTCIVCARSLQILLVSSSKLGHSHWHLMGLLIKGCPIWMFEQDFI